MIYELNELPYQSSLCLDKHDYFDVFKLELDTIEASLNSTELSKVFFKSVPNWVGVLFALRNKLVSIFGLKTSKGSDEIDMIINNFKGRVGDTLGFFRVYYSSEDEIILGEDDKHLNFRTSLLLNRNKGKNNIFISTTVVYHNNMGRIYFFIVKPFHKRVVKSMLKKMHQRLSHKK